MRENAVKTAWDNNNFIVNGGHQWQILLVQKF